MVNGFKVEPGSKTSVSASGARTAVGVVCGPVRQRQDFAALHIEHDQRTGLRLVAFDSCLELAKCQVLKAGVERECKIAAFLRCTNAGDILDDLAAPIDDDAARSRLAAEP